MATLIIPTITDKRKTLHLIERYIDASSKFTCNVFEPEDQSMVVPALGGGWKTVPADVVKVVMVFSKLKYLE